MKLITGLLLWVVRFCGRLTLMVLKPLPWVACLKLVQMTRVIGCLLVSGQLTCWVTWRRLRVRVSWRLLRLKRRMMVWRLLCRVMVRRLWCRRRMVLMRRRVLNFGLQRLMLCSCLRLSTCLRVRLKSWRRLLRRLKDLWLNLTNRLKLPLRFLLMVLRRVARLRRLMMVWIMRPLSCRLP